MSCCHVKYVCCVDALTLQVISSRIASSSFFSQGYYFFPRIFVKFTAVISLDAFATENHLRKKDLTPDPKSKYIWQVNYDCGWAGLARASTVLNKQKRTILTFIPYFTHCRRSPLTAWTVFLPAATKAADTAGR